MTQEKFNEIIQSGLNIAYDYTAYLLKLLNNEPYYVEYTCYKTFAHEMDKTRFSKALDVAIKEIDDSIKSLLKHSNHQLITQKTIYLFLFTFAREVNKKFKTNYHASIPHRSCINHINLNDWRAYNHGDNNIVYISSDNKKIMRRARNPFNDITNQDRFYYLWKQIYPEYSIQKKGPWLELPFFGWFKPSDEEINAEVIRIYRMTRVIMTDAWIQGNFLRHQNKTICVDLEHGVWKGDKVSEDYVEHVLMGTYRYEAMCQNNTLSTVATICTLLYLEKFLEPEQIKSEYCTINIIKALHQYRIKQQPITLILIETLLRADASCILLKKENKQQVFLVSSTSISSEDSSEVHENYQLSQSSIFSTKPKATMLTAFERSQARCAYQAYQDKIKAQDPPDFDALPIHTQQGLVAFAKNAHHGVKEAWQHYADTARSDTFKALCVFFPSYDALQPNKKAAVEHAATSIRYTYNTM